MEIVRKILQEHSLNKYAKLSVKEKICKREILKYVWRRQTKTERISTNDCNIKKGFILFEVWYKRWVKQI